MPVRRTARAALLGIPGWPTRLSQGIRAPAQIRRRNNRTNARIHKPCEARRGSRHSTRTVTTTGAAPPSNDERADRLTPNRLQMGARGGTGLS